MSLSYDKGNKMLFEFEIICQPRSMYMYICISMLIAVQTFAIIHI